MHFVRVEWNGQEHFLPESALDWREAEKIRSEINTNYVKYRNGIYCVHISYGLDGYPYEYYFVNRGFDDYHFYAKIPSED